jgi:hypothetical protein
MKTGEDPNPSNTYLNDTILEFKKKKYDFWLHCEYEYNL